MRVTHLVSELRGLCRRVGGRMALLGEHDIVEHQYAQLVTGVVPDLWQVDAWIHTRPAREFVSYIYLT